MNTHTTNLQSAAQSRQAIFDELHSPPPSLLDTILDRLAKPSQAPASRAILPFATVVLTPDGAPIRSILTGRRVIVTGFYTSRKAGRALPYEGMNELALLKRCEVDTAVVDYRSQPLRFEIVIGGVKRTYIADCVRLMDDGTIEVIEAKGSPQQLRQPDYAEKLNAVRSACGRLGWRFRALTGKHLFEPHHLYANIDQIQSRRFVRFNGADAYRAAEFIEREGGQTPLGHLTDALGCGPRGLATAQAMMVRRLISIELTKPLSAESFVTLVADRSVEGTVAL